MIGLIMWSCSNIVLTRVLLFSRVCACERVKSLVSVRSHAHFLWWRAQHSATMPRHENNISSLHFWSSGTFLGNQSNRFDAGAREKSFFGMLPLHLACAKKAPVEVVAALLAAHPDGEAA